MQEQKLFIFPGVLQMREFDCGIWDKMNRNLMKYTKKNWNTKNLNSDRDWRKSQKWFRVVVSFRTQRISWEVKFMMKPKNTDQL